MAAAAHAKLEGATATRGCRRSGTSIASTQQQLQHISKMVQRTDTDDSGEEEVRSAVPTELPV